MTQVDITPESAGWRYAGLKTAEFAGSYQFFTAADEALVLPLSGSCTVRCGTEEFLLQGRKDVFSRRLLELTRVVAVIGLAVLIPIVAFNRQFVSLWVGHGRYASHQTKGRLGNF